MARPQKKPGYDREAEIADLIATAAALFDIAYDDRIYRPQDAPSINSVAEEMGTTALRVRKFLITANMYSTAISRHVQELDTAGESVETIMKATGLGKASVYSYLTFKKGAYNLPNPTLYSDQVTRYRNRKRAVEELRKHIGKPDELYYLWKCICQFENYPFTTSERGKDNTGTVKFKYIVSRSTGDAGRHYSGQSVDDYGNELWIKGREKSISRSTVDLAYRNARKEQERSGFVSGPDKLDVPYCHSQLYALILRFGVITQKASKESDEQ